MQNLNDDIDFMLNNYTLTNQDVFIKTILNIVLDKDKILLLIQKLTNFNINSTKISTNNYEILFILIINSLSTYIFLDPKFYISNILYIIKYMFDNKMFKDGFFDINTYNLSFIYVIFYTNINIINYYLDMLLLIDKNKSQNIGIEILKYIDYFTLHMNELSPEIILNYDIIFLSIELIINKYNIKNSDFLDKIKNNVLIGFIKYRIYKSIL